MELVSAVWQMRQIAFSWTFWLQFAVLFAVITVRT